MRSPVIRRLVPLLFLSILALIVSLPSKVNLLGREIERPKIDFEISGKKIQKDFNLVLGLDLIGGSHLVFEADTTKVSQDKKSQALESLREVIEKRVNLFGVSEPNIQLSSFEGKDRVIVELPGVKDTNQAIELVGKTAQLMFMQFEGSEESPEVKPTDLSGADLKQALVSFDQATAKPTVGLEFTDEGAKKFTSLTEKNVGKPLPIVLDGQIISSPVVQEKIEGNQAVINGNFTLDEAKGLVIQLNAGSLPVPIILVEQRSVGATLGNESVQKSIEAGLVGITAVLVFMIVMYGKLGVVADIGLIIFGLLTFSLYKLIPVVLTLPGIAGFLLSVGMAVDSNILIFERFREERKIRGNIQDALESSFGRAWDSIRDANIATLITAFILANPLDWSFLHTSGPVRGFAITLALGIGVSMFTGIYVSRNLLRLVIRSNKR